MARLGGLPRAPSATRPMGDPGHQRALGDPLRARGPRAPLGGGPRWHWWAPACRGTPGVHSKGPRAPLDGGPSGHRKTGDPGGIGGARRLFRWSFLSFWAAYDNDPGGVEIVTAAGIGAYHGAMGCTCELRGAPLPIGGCNSSSWCTTRPRGAAGRRPCSSLYLWSGRGGLNCGLGAGCLCLLHLRCMHASRACQAGGHLCSPAARCFL